MRYLLEFFGDKLLAQINGDLCRKYVAQRSTNAAARRELEDLRAAVNHYQHEGLMRETVGVWLPKRQPARERWLSRAEAARLVLTAWRYRERQNGDPTMRRPRQHVARFILVALYAGRRAGAITEAAFAPEAGRGWIDVGRGVFYPRAGMVQGKKRQPPIMLPRRLVAHLRRWKRKGQRYVIEWQGQPIGRMNKAFRHAAQAAGFGREVTPHVLRHTSATWLMQRGADRWAAAGYLGMSMETLDRTYGHHHPDHQKTAWSVFDRPGGEPKVKAKGRKSNRKATHAAKRAGVGRGSG
jgi:integrase